MSSTLLSDPLSTFPLPFNPEIFHNALHLGSKAFEILNELLSEPQDFSDLAVITKSQVTYFW